MDTGSNKSFAGDEGDEAVGSKQRDSLLQTLNMGQLIQNPGRPSLGSGENSKERLSRGGGGGKTGNIFAAKVRKTVESNGEKNRDLVVDKHVSNFISSGAASSDDDEG